MIKFLKKYLLKIAISIMLIFFVPQITNATGFYQTFDIKKYPSKIAKDEKINQIQQFANYLLTELEVCAEFGEQEEYGQHCPHIYIESYIRFAYLLELNGYLSNHDFEKKVFRLMEPKEDLYDNQRYKTNPLNIAPNFSKKSQKIIDEGFIEKDNSDNFKYILFKIWEIFAIFEKKEKNNDEGVVDFYAKRGVLYNSLSNSLPTKLEMGKKLNNKSCEKAFQKIKENQQFPCNSPFTEALADSLTQHCAQEVQNIVSKSTEKDEQKKIKDLQDRVLKEIKEKHDSLAKKEKIDFDVRTIQTILQQFTNKKNVEYILDNQKGEAKVLKWLPFNDEEKTYFGQTKITDYSKDITVAVTTSQCGLRGFRSIVCSVSRAGGRMADELFENIVEKFLRIKIKSYLTLNVKPFVKIVNDIAMTILTLFFIFMTIAQITGYQKMTFGLRAFLPKLIIAAVGIGFFNIVFFMAIDVSNIIGDSLKYMFDGIVVQLGVVEVSALNLTPLIAGLLAYSVVLWRSGPSIFFAILMVMTVLVGMLVLFLTIALRDAFLIMSLVLYPLFMVFFAFPNTKKISEFWLKIMINSLVMYPMASFAIGFGYLIRSIMILSSDNPFIESMAVAMAALPLILLPLIIKKFLKIVPKIAEKTSGSFAKSRELINNNNYLNEKKRSHSQKVEKYDRGSVKDIFSNKTKKGKVLNTITNTIIPTRLYGSFNKHYRKIAKISPSYSYTLNRFSQDEEQFAKDVNESKEIFNGDPMLANHVIGNLLKSSGVNDSDLINSLKDRRIDKNSQIIANKISKSKDVHSILAALETGLPVTDMGKNDIANIINSFQSEFGHEYDGHLSDFFNKMKYSYRDDGKFLVAEEIDRVLESPNNNRDNLSYIPEPNTTKKDDDKMSSETQNERKKSHYKFINNNDLSQRIYGYMQREARPNSLKKFKHQVDSAETDAVVEFIYQSSSPNQMIRKINHRGTREYIRDKIKNIN